MSFFGRCCLYSAISITILADIAIAYQFDVDNLIVYEDATSIKSGHRGSYSGFSVALWNQRDAGLPESWIFIGAPKANTTNYKEINEPGTIFKCEIGKNCGEWVMKNTNSMGPNAGSWLGGSMEIRNGTNPEIVVCAPRWLDHRPKKRPGTEDVWLMKGICYTASMRSFSQSQKPTGNPMVPMDTIVSSEHRSNAMAECGFSIHTISEFKPTILLGCPGFSWGYGIATEYSSDGHFQLSDKKNQEDTQYLGYAVTSGYYFGRKNGRWNAASEPRSAKLTGVVMIYRLTANSVKVKLRIFGKQVGEYFGSTLASCDIDGDGSDNLIVGAPQWTKIVDEGHIYNYRENFNGSFQEPQVIQGQVSRGKFGSTITCLGDIDYDTYDDVAVSAPYEGNGVIYIYHGSRDGLKLTQRIPGPEYTKGFGISISNPIDIDDNGHADIAVGAYLSGHAILFRSKRTITTSVEMFVVTSLNKALQLNATSFSIEVCSSYNGSHPPQELRVVKELKVEEIHQRAGIEIDGASIGIHKFSEILNLQSKSCKKYKIKLKEGHGNFLIPLQLSVSQRLDTSNKTGTLFIGKNKPTGADYFDKSIAAMPYELTRTYLEVPFAVQCENNVCNSHLLIRMVTNLGSGNLYVIGSKKHIELNITVMNLQDPAFLTKAILTVPSLVQLSRMPPTCIRESMNGSIHLICNVGNPLYKNEKKNLSLSLDMSRVTNSREKIDFSATATTQSNDLASEDHKYNLPINCIAQTDIGIIRKLPQDSYSFTLVRKEASSTNIMFQHIYEIKNYEVTPIAQALLSVSIPTHWIHFDNEIEIAKLNRTTGYVNGQEFYCEDAVAGSSLSYDATTNTEWWMGRKSSMILGSNPDEKFTIIQDKIFASSPDNRTLHINCTNPSVKCKTINCNLVFGRSQPVAKLSLNLDLLLSNLSFGIIQEEDIIFFVTNSSVKILGSPGETVNNEPNLIMAGTMFFEALPETRVPVWIIALSIFVGLLLLVLIILGLFKFGFFNRKKQVELQALLKRRDDEAALENPKE